MSNKIIQFPLKKEISGPMTMDAEDFKANLRAAFLSGEAMMKERAAKIAENFRCYGAAKQSVLEVAQNIRAITTLGDHGQENGTD